MASQSVIDRARRIVAQHAATSRLMGADFVPSYRTSDLDLAAAILTESGQDAQFDTAIESDSRGDLTPQREPKPLQLQAQTTSTSRVLFEAKPMPAVNAAPSPSPAAVAVKRDSSRTAADVERDLAQIRADYEHDAPHRAFVTHFNNIVFGEGNPLARIMFVGEAPGEEEDKTGRPFVGRAGQLLEKMIVGMGLKRPDVYIANILKTRPPNNATPTIDECMICMPYIARQIAAIRPEAIVTLGLTSTKALLKTDQTMSRLRGVWTSYQTVDGVLIPVMPTFHPAYVLRAYTDENRTKVWNDLKMVLQRLELPVPARA
ncbi:MAG: uracil-DNA glycosylase [Planctomycetes bacterium]|nr:uracil-DNA glycosylase [Planctomycetota bacterium]